ncbi:MAG TPA: SRPBCC domain-containing protein [Trebonia sp.]|jgi:uncharacterized protein YndB with AHSA1/START domain|nr:SRPBCC domain-containing protein [Trebonia sp.]
MTADSPDLAAIAADVFLPHAPDQVWRALTDPDVLARWLMPNDFKPVVGHKFTFRARPVPAAKFSGTIACEVLELRPAELLVISWRDAGEGNDLDTTVTWRLEPEGRGTRLFLLHDGFDPDHPLERLARSAMANGWAIRILPALAAVLEDAAP